MDIVQRGAVAHVDIISDSWARCQQDYDLEPTLFRPVMRLQSHEVMARQEALLEKLGDSRAIIDRLSDLMIQTGQCLVITDTEKVVVDIARPNSADPEFAEHGIELGSIWNEETAGTNGVNMAFATGRAFTVQGTEHFFNSLKHFTCSGVPILDAADRTIAIVSLSDLDKGDKGLYTIARECLTDTADKMQRELFHREYEDYRIFRFRYLDHRRRNRQNAVIAVDEDNVIVASTIQAEMVGEAQRRRALVGQPVDAIFHPDAYELIPTKLPQRHLVYHSHLPPNLKQENNPIEDRPRQHLRRPRRLPSKLRGLALGSQKLLAQIERAQSLFESGAPLMIGGETGTGKTVLAQSLLTNAPLEMRLIRLDYANPGSTVFILENLLQEVEELSDSRFGAAIGLLVERVEDMPVTGQAKLLAFLEEPTIEALRQNGRFHNLTTCSEIKKDRLRPDLYYRLGAGAVTLPPLRHRDHLLRTVEELLVRIAGRSVALDPATAAAFVKYDWPGNLHELVGVLRQAFVCGNGERINFSDLPAHMVSDSTNFEGFRPNKTSQKKDHCDEEQDIRTMLDSTNWNVSKAARKLGIGRATIHRKIRRYGLQRGT